MDWVEAQLLHFSVKEEKSFSKTEKKHVLLKHVSLEEACFTKSGASSLLIETSTEQFCCSSYKSPIFIKFAHSHFYSYTSVNILHYCFTSRKKKQNKQILYRGFGFALQPVFCGETLADITKGRLPKLHVFAHKHGVEEKSAASKTSKGGTSLRAIIALDFSTTVPVKWQSFLNHHFV